MRQRGSRRSISRTSSRGGDSDDPHRAEGDYEPPPQDSRLLLSEVEAYLSRLDPRQGGERGFVIDEVAYLGHEPEIVSAGLTLLTSEGKAVRGVGRSGPFRGPHDHPPRLHRFSGGARRPALQKTVGVAVCEKNSTAQVENRRRECALEGCEATFTPPARAPDKRYCYENHQRTAEKRRYRERHKEWAHCKGCSRLFERVAVSGPGQQVYCRHECQATSPHLEYRQREDIQAGIRRAQEAA